MTVNWNKAEIKYIYKKLCEKSENTNLNLKDK